jgi:hypothetical protein
MYCEQEDCTVYSLHVKDLLQKIQCRQTTHHYIETRFAPNISVFSISATHRVNDARSWRYPVSLITKSRFSITNISAISMPKAQRVPQLYNEPITNRIIQKIENRSNWYVTLIETLVQSCMSLLDSS